VRQISKVFENLNAEIVKEELLMPELIKLQKSLRSDSMNNLKKILVFIMENKDIANSAINELTQLLARLFGHLPKP